MLYTGALEPIKLIHLMRTTTDITVEQPQTAVDALSIASGLPKQRIKDAMTKGACWWTRKGKQVRLRRAKQALSPGTRVQLFYDSAVLSRKPEPPECLEDRGRYSVWFKPHGLLSQGSQWGDHCSLLRLAEIQLGKPCYLVHRLDADAAGLMLIAHDSKAAGALSQCFSGRTMTKVYLATATGEFQADNQQVDSPVDGKPALSRVTSLETRASTAGTTLVRVAIETGRKHQIRRHLASLGHPIVGDRLYGTAAAVPLQLLAWQLAFTCPLSQQQVHFELPERLITLLPSDSE